MPLSTPAHLATPARLQEVEEEDEEEHSRAGARQQQQEPEEEPAAVVPKYDLSASEKAFEEFRGKRGLRVIQQRTAIELERLEKEENDLRGLLSRLGPKSQPKKEGGPNSQHDDDGEGGSPKAPRSEQPKTLRERLGLSNLVKELREGLASVPDNNEHALFEGEEIREGPSTVRQRLSLLHLARKTGGDGHQQQQQHALSIGSRIVTPALSRRPVSAQTVSVSATNDTLLSEGQRYNRPSTASFVLRRTVQEPPTYKVPQQSWVSSARPSSALVPGASRPTSSAASASYSSTHEGRAAAPATGGSSTTNEVLSLSEKANAMQPVGGSKQNYAFTLSQQRKALNALGVQDSQYRQLLRHQQQHAGMVRNAVRELIDYGTKEAYDGHHGDQSQPPRQRPSTAKPFRPKAAAGTIGGGNSCTGRNESSSILADEDKSPFWQTEAEQKKANCRLLGHLGGAATTASDGVKWLPRPHTAHYSR